jgi:hypothetical protein
MGPEKEAIQRLSCECTISEAVMLLDWGIDGSENVCCVIACWFGREWLMGKIG